MNSATEGERSKPGSPCEFDYDPDGDLRRFDEEWGKNGGFDVDFSKLRETFGAGAVDLEDDDFLEPDSDFKSNREWLNDLCVKAISYYKEKTDISLELVSALRANYHPSAMVTLYITFEANDGNQTKPYYAVVRYFPRIAKVYACSPTTQGCIITF